MRLKSKINGMASTIEIDIHQIIKYATVTNINSGIKLKFDGEQEESTLTYRATCKCEIGNRVVCVNDGFNILILGVLQ